MNRRTAALLVLTVVCAAPGLRAQDSLQGSREKMLRQHGVAQENDYPFLETPADVEQYADLGVLVPVTPAPELRLARVSFAVTRPEVRTFLYRLAGQFRQACGEPLTVTSLTRPMSEQPENASELSVHPAGMAVDVRRPGRRGCRRWLERKLLALQDDGVLAATKERKPAHYHVAVFPRQYAAMLERTGGELLALAPAQAAEPDVVAAPRARTASRHVRRESLRARYRVQPGDTLSEIAQRHGVTVALLKRVNGLRGSRIAPGQVLTIPAS